jgi:hypothetical protein
MKKLILISAMALGLIGVGCSKTSSNSNNNTNTATGGTPTTGGGDPGAPLDGPTTGGNGSGYTVEFKPSNLEAMRQYVLPGAPHVALNNPTNLRINLNLAQAASGRYGGNITISYVDNGVTSTGVLTAGSGRNPTIKGGYDNDRLQSDYNYFFTFENQLVFTGFFEDQFGSITIALTPDEPIGGGNDAEPLTVPYKGSIYFKNFKNTSGQFVVKNQPYRPCWFIYTGVFDCRSTVIQSKSGLEPGVGAGYTLLGTFTNVDIKKAFNIN